MQKCDGVKILDLEEKHELAGNEYLVTAEKGENYKIPVESVTDAILNSSKFKAAIANVYESSVPTANVTLEENQFLFSFGIPAGRKGDDGKDGKDGINGKDGKDGIPGMPGIDGDTTRLVIAFKSTSTPDKPDTPIGGSWDYATNVVTYPEGWSGNDANPNGYLWASNATFSSNGTIVANWSDPIPFGGRDGKDGADGTNIQYVYKLTITHLTKPNPDHPIGSLEDAIVQGWTDHPTGISEEYQCEWVSYRSLESGSNVWNEWQPCTIWSRWGTNGKDGDGIEYVYQRTTLPIPPHVITDNNADQDEYIPQSQPGEQPWTDNPSGINETYKYEWVSKRKYGGETKKWSNFSNPAQWCRYGDKGQDGQGLRVMYTKTSGSDVTPVILDRLNINPGSIWSNKMPEITGKEALWAIQALVTYDNKLYIDTTLPEEERGWQGPCLISGVPGLDGNNWNYQVEVFKLSDTEPARPTNSDPYHPNNGWILTPDSSYGVWWKCVATVSGETGQVIEWGAPIKQTGTTINIKGQLDNTSELPMTGNAVNDAYIIDGVLYVWNGEAWIASGRVQGPQGPAGNYTEYIFARNNSWETPPTLDLDERFPDTTVWSISAPPESKGKVLWSTYATISGADNTLLTNWCTPYYLTPLEATPVAGIPGVGYEIRYCKGTETTYIGTYNNTVKTTRDPSSYGWSLDYPDITTDTTYNFVWFIQARIIDGEFENPSEGWWKPQPFSGVITPDPQTSNPIVYPAGVFSPSVTYINDGTTAPYVFFEGKYYVLTKISADGWISSGNNNENPANSESWLEFKMFDAYFTKVGIIENGLIGGAVFNNNRMFSQRGVDADGQPSASFELLTTHNTNEPITTANIMNGSTGFTPNFLLDFTTGEAYFNAGGIHLSGDDESTIKLKNGNYLTTLDKSGLSVTNQAAGYIGGDLVDISNQGIFIDMPVSGNTNRHTYFNVNTSGAELRTQDTIDTTYPFDFNSVQHFKFNADGSGQIANGNITWTSDGVLTVHAIITDVDLDNDQFIITFPNTGGLTKTYIIETPVYTRAYPGHELAGSVNRVTLYKLPTTYYGTRLLVSVAYGNPITLPENSVFSVTNHGGGTIWTITQIACRDAIQ